MFRFAPLESYPVYSISDPSLNLDASNLDAYGETLDPAHLVSKPGECLATFWLRPLTTRRKARLDGAAAGGRPLAEIAEAGGKVESVSYEQAFRHAELALRLTLERVDGIEVGGEPWEILRDSDGLVRPESLAPFGPDLIFELGNYAREVSQLPLAAGRSSDG